MRALTTIFLLVLCLASSKAAAEYRVYDLEINGPDGTRTVRGTLDDQQYTGYYPLYTGEKIKIAATWMCWERTDWDKPYCDKPVPAPKVPAAPRAPAST